MTAPDPRLAQIENAYNQKYARFLHVATAITGDAELAADAVQEGFVRAIGRRHTYRGAGSVEGWLWRIIINTARDLVGRRRDSSAIDDAAFVPSNEGPIDPFNVRAVVAELPERQRLVLFLRYFADLDYEAIGQALEISSGTVGATLHKAHGAIRVQIQEVKHSASE